MTHVHDPTIPVEENPLETVYWRTMLEVLEEGKLMTIKRKFAITCSDVLTRLIALNDSLERKFGKGERPELSSTLLKGSAPVQEACWTFMRSVRPPFKEISSAIQEYVLKLDPDLEYLQQAVAVLEKRERAISACHPSLQLNAKQSTRLWQHIKSIIGCFLSCLTLLHRRIRSKCIPIFEEFYVIVTRADSIVQQFSSERSWLEAAILQRHHRQAFLQLTQDLRDCTLAFCKLVAESLHNVPNFDSDPNLRPDVDTYSNTLSDHGLGVSAFSSRSLFYVDGDYHLDVDDFKNTLQQLITQQSLDDEEDLLAEYLFEREQGKPSTRDKYVDQCGYQASNVEEIGRGASGSVYKVDWLGMICAKKHFSGVHGEESMKERMREVSVLEKLNHPHIVKLLCMSKPPEVSFLMEIMPMSLSDFIKERWNNPEGNVAFTLPAALDIMLQIARGMEHLHEQGIVHRDLKSSNILVTPSRFKQLRDMGYADVKLTDFGLAKMKVHDLTHPTREMMGTSRWRAPEAFGRDRPIDWKKADAYSLGMTCSEILTGKMPFSFGLQSELHGRILKGERPKLPSTCPSDLASLLQACWKTTASSRPSFSHIKETLTSIKMSLLLSRLKMGLKNRDAKVPRLSVQHISNLSSSGSISFIVFLFSSAFLIFWSFRAYKAGVLGLSIVFYILGVLHGRQLVGNFFS